MARKREIVKTDLSEDLVKAFEGASIVALDIEGVDLSRDGQISLVQLAASPESCFLLDLLKKTKDDPLVNWLRIILESNDILKVIHDCRIDADALRHILGIELRNIHDTSCWHFKLTGKEDVNLNTVLTENSIRPNVKRDSSVYARNHAFWATRPLTPTMIEWAVGDIQFMFELYTRQIEASTPTSAMEAKALSDTFLDSARSCHVTRVAVRNVGMFIGRAGANIRALQKASNTLVYPRGNRDEGMFLVYYKTPEGLTAVRQRANA
jgi:ribonuclease D